MHMNSFKLGLTLIVNGAIHVRQSNLANQCPHASLSFSILGAFLRHGPINHGLPRGTKFGRKTTFNEHQQKEARRRLDACDSTRTID
jgi:hypothetical protein